MHEILRHLPAGSRVLDLGSGAGSFDPQAHPVLTTRVDLEFPPQVPTNGLVKADAANLPFKRGSFDAVICNHSLEHFLDLDAVFRELGRILSRDGAFYAAVPDSQTLTDILYRWLARGGGHVNKFPSVEQLIGKIEAGTGLKHAGTRLLCSSLSFMNARNLKKRPPGRLILLGGGRESLLIALNALFRISDRLLGTRMSVYGWAVYFGVVGGAIDRGPWTNVCVRCGSGHPSKWLLSSGSVKRRYWLLRFYTCPACGASNLFTCDGAYVSLR